MRNPNGYGSVVKLSGNRRRPYVVRKTAGWDDRGFPIYNTIGYTTTREEGMILLAQYNNNPWDIDKEKTTFEELYKLWKEKKMPKLGEANQRSLCSAYKHCKKIYNMKYKLIKMYHMQDVIDNCGKKYATQSAIKNLFMKLDELAFELDIINKCYSASLTVDPVPDSNKIPFTNEEIKKVWEIKRQDWVDSILVFLYSGFRLSELLNMKITDVNLAEGTFVGGTKTKAGKDRIVPIHPKILDLVKRRIEKGDEYLFSDNGIKCTVARYYIFWYAIMEQLDMKHTPHECRHTFRSNLDSAGANKRCIDLLMGHKSKDVGERVYTHKSVQELKDTIELVTYE